ncbi:hypothetical protein [Spirosoma koreense]
MEQVFFTCLTPQGEFRECRFFGPDTEACFEALNGLVSANWTLLSASLIDRSLGIRALPLVAFDGKSINEPLSCLQKQWQEVLYAVEE